MDIRNIAVIAHVDHGKTTLVDALLKQSHVFRENQAEMSESLIMDRNELERERGITILAKNCAITYKDTKINIIDTPGHADFSGEVERTLSMANGALLIIDAQEGPMPQTRFVLKKALELQQKIIVVINKIDKQFARVTEVRKKIDDLFLELITSEDQLDFPVLYAVARNGAVFSELPTDPEQAGTVVPLLDLILSYIPAPFANSSKPFKMVISSLDYDSHVGQIAIGRVHQGTITKGQNVVVNGKQTTIEKVMASEGLDWKEVEIGQSGDIISLSGIDEIAIGLTVSDPADTTPLPTPAIGKPTLHMTIGPNTSPFAGREGQFVTGRQIEERLMRELKSNLSLKVEKLESGKYKLSGRGELHLAVLLETMRRESYEMEVGKPEVITQTNNGIVEEPVEEVDVLVPQEYVGVINQELGKRFAELIHMAPMNEREVEFVYKMPTRALLGLRSLLLTLTKGTVLFSSQFSGYQEMGKPLPKLRKGVIISFEAGQALTYGLAAAQERGINFIAAGTHVYEGMIVGLHAKEMDIEVNVCKGKKLTNMRSKSSDGVIQLAPPVLLSLEQSLDFLEDDELLEITPKSLRLRKKYLTLQERKRNTR